VRHDEAVTVTLDLVVFDAADIERVGGFYADLTGARVSYDGPAR
jgi:hypothetical protein